jgi:nicotinamidase-related amidase
LSSPGSILRGSHDWQLLPGLDELASPAERLADKAQYDAFLGTALERRLRDRGVRTVVVAGTLTNLCCEATAQGACGRGFDVVVLEDGCATLSERMHRASLENLAFGFGEVWKIADLMARLQ